MQPVAHVAHLGRYPVKSMRGENPEELAVGLEGTLGDRRYAFVRTDTPSGFPWLTGRQAAELILYTPRFERAPTPAEPEPPLWVSAPEGDDYRIDDPALRQHLEGRFGHPLFLLHDKGGVFDEAHLSLFGLPTLHQLGREVGRPLERERFRANLYIEPVDGRPFTEDGWVGRTLQIGASLRLAVTLRDRRCAMTTLDPATAAAEPGVLRTIAQAHERCAGVLGAILAIGPVRLGDPIYLVD